MNSNLVKDSIVLMIGRGIGLVIAVITPFILVRIFSVEQYGEYRQVMLLVTTFAGLLPLGLRQSLYYFIPYYPLEKGIYVARTLIFPLVISLLLFLVVVLFRSAFADFFNDKNFAIYSPLTALVGVLLSLSLVIETVVLVDRKVFLSAKITVLSRFFRGIIIIVCAWFGGVLAILYGLIGYYFFKSLLSICYFVRNGYFTFNLSVFTKASENIRYSSPLLFAGILMMAISSIDKYIISFLFTPNDFAIYSIGCYEFPFIAIFFASIGDVTLPKIVEYKRDGKIDKVLQLWKSSIEKSLLIGIPLFVFSFAFADSIIVLLFTDKYISAVPIFRIFLVQILLESARYGGVVRALGKTSIALYATVISLLILLPCCYFGAEIAGLLGVAYAVIIAGIIHAGIQLWWSAVALNIRKIDIFPVKSICYMVSISCIILVIVFYGALPLDMWIFNSKTLLGVQFFIYIILYIVFTNMFYLWKIDELPLSDTVKQKVRKFFSLLK